MVTVTGTVPLPIGTVAVSSVSGLVALGTNGACAPPKLTAVMPVKPVPVTVTSVQAGPAAGRRPLTAGGAARP